MYVPLCVRSVYNYNSTVSIEEVMKTCQERGIRSLSVVDVQSMHHIIECIEYAKRYHIQCLIACEFEIIQKEKKEKRNVVLYAKNERGYQSLIELNQKGKRYITTELLQTYGKELLAICTEVEQKETLDEIASILQKENVYIGVSKKQVKQDTYMKKIQQWSYPMVAINEVRYIEKKDYETAQILTAIHENKKIEECVIDGKELDSYEEISHWYREYPRLIEETNEIAKKCQVHIGLKGDAGFQRKLPDFPIPPTFTYQETVFQTFDEMDGFVLPKEEKKRREIAYLLTLSWLSFRHIYGTEDQVAIARMKYELGIIIGKGFTEYFLIIYDLIRFAKKARIPYAPRGSAANSVVSRCLGITPLCPIEYGLVFERFLNPERQDDPDVDLDFSAERRKEIFQYIQTKYGEMHAAQIIAFDNYGKKSAFQCIAKLYKIKDAEKISKWIPEKQGTVEDILRSKEGSRLKNRIEKNKSFRKILEWAWKIEGFPRNETTHPGGVVISKEPFTKDVPVTLSQLKGTKVSILKTQISNDDGRLEKFGYPKIDVLGLSALDVFEGTKRLIEKTTEKTITDIPLNDPKTMEMFAKGGLVGVFQMTSREMRRSAMLVKPSNIEEIAILLALYRPGPMEQIPLFAENKHTNTVHVCDADGNELSKTEDLLPILKSTYGIIVYQEQIIEIAHIWAGYTRGKADLLRRAISKKKDEVLKKEKIDFIQSSVKNGRDPHTSEKIYELIEKFGRYGYGKGHATLYALLTYWIVYLKTYYPQQYMTALLGNIIKEKTASNYYQEAVRMKLPMNPPDINDSFETFVYTPYGIKFGIPMVKGIGETTALEIVKERKERGNFTSFEDFLYRMQYLSLTEDMKTALVKAGMFDTLNTRKECLSLLRTDKKQIKQTRRTYRFSDIPNISPDWLGEKEKDEFSEEECWKMELESVNMIVKHPVYFRKKQVQSMVKRKEGLVPSHQKVTMALIKRVKYQKDRFEKDMARITVDTEYGEKEYFMFHKALKQYKQAVEPYSFVLLYEEKRSERGRVIEKIEKIPQEDRLTVTFPSTLQQKSKEEQKKWMMQFLQILQKHPGFTEVEIQVGESSKLLQWKYCVAYSESLTEELGRFLGNAESFHVKKFR